MYKKFIKPLIVLCLIIILAINSTIIYASEVNTDDISVNEDAVETSVQADNPNLALTSKSAILMEASTGTVIYEQNPDEKLSPASITKIMTLILIFDALKEGKITLEDKVTTSAYAKSMGGSQVFLEEGEQQTVDTLIKCIVIASGNDASVTMAEYICGSEAEFINQMNQRAQGLGMTNTHFEDCCGLTDSTNHYTTARDVAIMSRELITKYPQIFNYSTIWMENITHVTAKGTSEFGLSNTNKLLKQYEWATGLKTGSTSVAKYCVSATAKKDGMDLIAVIMAAPDYKVRFSEAISLFNYGYSNCKLYTDSDMKLPEQVRIQNGVKDNLTCQYSKQFTYLSKSGENTSEITKEIKMNKDITAPIKKGDVVGQTVYSLQGTEIGSVDILAAESIKSAGFADYFKKVLNKMFV
jgi:D-alanyl-D-alanine carboxypeptidase (penicillin-binding protein 5/6)